MFQKAGVWLDIILEGHGGLDDQLEAHFSSCLYRYLCSFFWIVTIRDIVIRLRYLKSQKIANRLAMMYRYGPTVNS
jgi:Ni/Fe-hydrogenase subunit HybB-like protein